MSLREIVQLIQEAPLSLTAVTKGEWRLNTQIFGPYFEEAERRGQEPENAVMMDAASRYWRSEYPGLNEKILITSISALVDGFFNRSLHELFCPKESTLIPEAVQSGAVILIDLPIKEYESVGPIAQNIWKYYFQKSIERRTDPAGPARRPVFLWIDESQFFFSGYDSHFQSIARSERMRLFSMRFWRQLP